MEDLIPIRAEADVPAAWRSTPVGELVRTIALRHPFPTEGARPALLIGFCPHEALRPMLPEDAVLVLDCGDEEFRLDEFSVSHAVAVAGVRAIVLIGCDRCGRSATPLRTELRGLKTRFPKLTIVGLVYTGEKETLLVLDGDA